MIVDDNHIDIKIQTRILKKCDRIASIISVMDVVNALELFEDFATGKTMQDGNFPPDLLLLDYHMPKLNGVEFTNQLSRLYPQGMPTTVVLLTSAKTIVEMHSPEEIERITEHVVKPLTTETAFALTERYL